MRAVFGFSDNDRLDFIFAVPCPQCPKTDKAFLPAAFDGGMLSSLDFIALLFQLLKKGFKVCGLLVQQDVVDYGAQLIPITFSGWIKSALLPLPVRLDFNNGQLMFQTNQITQSLHRKPRQQKIPEFPGAIQCSRIVDDVIVNVFSVGMGRNDKSILALGKPHGKFITDLVGFLGGDLSGLERLPNLIGNHIIFLPAPGHQFILAFGEHKFFIDRQRTAFVTADQFALLCLVRVLGVIRAAFQAGGNGFSLVFVQCNQSGCCQFYHLPVKRKYRTMAAYRFYNSAIQPLNHSTASTMTVPAVMSRKQPNSATSRIRNCVHSRQYSV